jgi:hypothetical protein
MGKKHRMLEQFSISTYEISSHALRRSTLQPCVGGRGEWDAQASGTSLSFLVHGIPVCDASHRYGHHSRKDQPKCQDHRSPQPLGQTLSQGNSPFPSLCNPSQAPFFNPLA